MLILGLLFLAIIVRWVEYEFVEGEYRRSEYTTIARIAFTAVGALFILFLFYPSFPCQQAMKRRKSRAEKRSILSTHSRRQRPFSQYRHTP